MSFLKFWVEAICASFSVGWGVLGGVSTAMPVIFYFIGKYWPPSLEIPWLKWCVEHQNELHVTTAALFVIVYLVYAPFQLYSRERSLRIEAEGKVNGEPRIKFDVTDVDGRKELEKLRNELNEAQKTRNDPETRKELDATMRQLE